MLSNNVSTFDRNPRRIQEIRSRPIADRIYKAHLKAVQIERFDGNLLDTELAVDVMIRLQSGMVLCGQEKFLSQKYAKYASITVEYEQNQHTQERGDWFKEACQFYMVGYETEDRIAFDPWVIVNWPSLVLATNSGKVNWFDNKNKDGKARASFRWCRMMQLPMECIIASSWSLQ